MALIISYASNGRRAQAELEEWDADRGPDDVAFWFPEDADEGDRIAYFIGGTRQAFVATGRVTSSWRRAGSGAWRGRYYLRVDHRRLVQPTISATEMERSTGLQVPKEAQVVPAHLAPAVWAALRHRPFDREARALEGARTEATSRRRDPKLRQAALQRAGGACEGCRTDFRSYADGLGSRCLVVHHLRQLSDTDEPEWTSIRDLAVVCANCHMIIHADSKKALTLKQLRKKLAVEPR